MSNSIPNWEKVSAFCINTVIVKVIKKLSTNLINIMEVKVEISLLVFQALLKKTQGMTMYFFKVNLSHGLIFEKFLVFRKGVKCHFLKMYLWPWDRKFKLSHENIPKFLL